MPKIIFDAALEKSPHFRSRSQRAFYLSQVHMSIRRGIQTRADTTSAPIKWLERGTGLSTRALDEKAIPRKSITRGSIVSPTMVEKGNFHLVPEIIFGASLEQLPYFRCRSQRAIYLPQAHMSTRRSIRTGADTSSAPIKWLEKETGLRGLALDDQANTAEMYPSWISSFSTRSSKHPYPEAR